MGEKLHIQIIDAHDDGQTRITSADSFVCRGGTEESHEATVEAVLKTTEDLKRAGKSIETADADEVVTRFLENL
jgi:hypothetical protein